jgi:hypothetical protein
MVAEPPYISTLTKMPRKEVREKWLKNQDTRSAGEKG